MIIKNEENNLSDLLPKVKEFVNEIIIIDTGSDDNSVKIAESLGAKVFFYKWDNNFSNARNEFIKHASMDHILFLDADERIPQKYLKRLPQILAHDLDGYQFPVHEYCNDEFINGFIPHKAYGFKGYYTYNSTPRLFKNKYKNKFKFSYPVHETVEPSIKEKNGKIGILDIPIIHLEKNKGEDYFKNKQKIYLEIQENFIKNNPDDQGIVKIMCDVALAKFKQFNEYKTAQEYLLRAKSIKPNYSRIYIILGEIYVTIKKYTKAIDCYSALISLGDELDSAYFNLGQIYYEQKSFDKAKEAYTMALKKGSQHTELIKNRLDELS